MTASLTAFLGLFTLGDADATQRLAERLALVLADPAGYVTRCAVELAERGIGAGLARQELRDVALLDALLAEDLAVECDWKEMADEVAESLNLVLTRQGRPQIPQPEALNTDGEPGPEQLDTVQDALEPLGLALVLFTLDSDSYPLGVVAQEAADTLAAQAEALGFGVSVY